MSISCPTGGASSFVRVVSAASLIAGTLFVPIDPALGADPPGQPSAIGSWAGDFDLDVDANRDGIVEEQEDAMEADASGRGALVIPNLDDDDRDGRPDAISFDRRGHPNAEDRLIQPGDGNDLVPIVVGHPGASELESEDARVLLSADADDLVAFHLFDSAAPGTDSFWGGTSEKGTSTDITSRLSDGASPAGRSIFMLEALFFSHDVRGAYGVFPRGFDGRMTLRLAVDDGSSVSVVDEVVVSVAPLLLIPNTRPAAEVWAGRARASNRPFLRDLAKSLRGSKLRTYRAGNRDDLWTQDHVEIGYTEAPGQPRTYVAVRLPRRPLPDWPAERLLGRDFGLTTVSGGDVDGRADKGGNLELLPPTGDHPLGRVIAGSTMSNRLFSFFVDQHVQHPVRIDTHWLAVGHVDEIIGIVGGGRDFTLVVNSPRLAFCLLGAGRPGCSEGPVPHSVLFSSDGPDPGMKHSVSGALAAVTSEADDVFIARHSRVPSRVHFVRIYRGKGAGQTARVHRTRGGRLEVDRVWRTGPPMDPDWVSDRACDSVRCPPRQGAPMRRAWFVRPNADSRLVLIEDTKTWPSRFLFESVPAAVTVAELRRDRNLRRLNVLVQRRIDRVVNRLERAAGTAVRVVEVPTLFIGRSFRGRKLVDRSVLAFTPNLANLQSVGGHAYVAEPHGPAGGDPLRAWVRDHLPTARFLETWAPYHRLDGEVHCATVVQRALPNGRWWR